VYDGGLSAVAVVEGEHVVTGRGAVGEVHTDVGIAPLLEPEPTAHRAAEAVVGGEADGRDRIDADVICGVGRRGAHGVGVRRQDAAVV
jgi:hypothetical protein